MAKFIDSNPNRRNDFKQYWDENWPGKADGEEFLTFVLSDAFSKLEIRRKIT